MKSYRKLDPEKVFRALLKQEGIAQPETEFVFAPPRKFRFDYCWRQFWIALEVEGGIWVRGRHSRGSGMLADMTKYNLAAVRGWMLIRTTPEKLCSSETIDTLKLALAYRGAA